MAACAVHGRVLLPRSSGLPVGLPRTVVVTPTSSGRPAGVDGLAASVRGGSSDGERVSVDLAVGVATSVGGTEVEPVGGETSPAGRTAVVEVAPWCSRSCSSTSPGVIGAGRDTLTSRATLSIAASTPNTTKAVVTIQVPVIRSTDPMTRVCDRSLRAGVKPP